MYSLREVESALDKEPLSKALYKMERFARAQGLADLEWWCGSELRGYDGSRPEEERKNREYRSSAVQWLDIFGRTLIVDPQISFIQSVPIWHGVSVLESHLKTGYAFRQEDAIGFLEKLTDCSSIAGIFVPPQQLEALLNEIRLEALRRVHDAAPRTPSEMTAPKSHSSPWATGSFYLITLVVIGTLFLVMAKSVSPFVLPVVMVASLLAVPIVGALQLRHDGRLSEKSFLELMGIAVKSLPLLKRGTPSNKSGGTDLSAVDGESQASSGNEAH